MTGPIPYIERTRASALGYTTPYRWARHEEVPFTRLPRPLGQARIALVTTATPIATAPGRYDAAGKFFAVYSGDSAQEHDLRINHVAIDFKHTSGADQASYFPLLALRRAAASGRIGALTRFHGVPPTAASAPRSSATRRSCSGDAARMAPMPPCWCRTAPSATRP